MIAQYLPTGLRKKRGDALEVVVQGKYFFFFFFWIFGLFSVSLEISCIVRMTRTLRII